LAHDLPITWDVTLVSPVIGFVNQYLRRSRNFLGDLLLLPDYKFRKPLLEEQAPHTIWLQKRTQEQNKERMKERSHLNRIRKPPTRVLMGALLTALNIGGFFFATSAQDQDDNDDKARRDTDRSELTKEGTKDNEV